MKKYPWDENQLSLGKPFCMDTDTLIEWIQRQLETPSETALRKADLDEQHRIWHQNNFGIYACCITWDTIDFSSITYTYLGETNV